MTGAPPAFDASDIVEIAGSPLKLAGLLLLGIGMTALSGWMGFAAGLAVGAQGLKIGFDDLLNLITRYADAHRTT